MVLFGFALLLVLGIVLFAVVSGATRRRNHLDRDYYLRQWKSIENFKNNGKTGWQLAIFEADKLLDHALKQLGYGGETMGERLKDARNNLTNNNAVWDAHKLRNRLAHEQNVSLNKIVADRALASFKTALKNLGAL